MTNLIRSWSVVFAIGGLAIALVGLLASSPTIAVAGVLISLIGEFFERGEEPSWNALNEAAFAKPMRSAARGIALIGVFAAPNWLVALGIAGIVASNAAGTLANNQMEMDYARPVEARGIPGVDPKPRSWIPLVLVGEMVVLSGLISDMLPISMSAVLAGGAICLLAVYPAVMFVLTARRAFSSGRRKPSLAAVQKYLNENKPVWLLHASGNADTAYQVEVWLSTLEKLQQPGIILLRHEALFEALPETSLPVVNLRSAGDVMNLDLSQMRVALFPAHVGNSVHLLRLPSMGTAFIGHGDSDKSGSANPFSRVYDQVWVAGAAGAERYKESGLDFASSAFVKVGRPQVSSVSQIAPNSPTLLYAPTWEGWDKNQEYSSLLKFGKTIVESAIGSGVRVIYRPHPLVGIRNPQYRTAHNEIIEMILAANDGITSPALVSPQLESVKSASERERLVMETSANYFAQLDPKAHVIADSSISTLDLISCFNASSAMITDVSSVITDYLESGKPYAVFSHLDDLAEFQSRFPSTSAGEIISTSQDVEKFLRIVTAQERDTKIDARKQLRDHTIGSGSGIEQFENALQRLAAIAEARSK